ncbi:hypothetical protein BGZ50_004114 [Haplosporangium sp. Z 11]|nr:hypothetical protein BGZ50_004114 [Haplosporangium sp. Z 11]
MSSDSSPINVGVIGFGMSAQVFHAPLISSTKGLNLAAFVCRSGPNLTLSSKYPSANVYQSHEQLLQDPTIQLVVITTPNTLHFDLARQALEAGKHVVVEKPFTVTFDQGIQLSRLAKQQSLVLSVFHNRRWDADFLTVQKLVQSQQSILGRIVNFESRFDRFRNFSKNGWRETGRVEDGSGVLYDLCSHLLDQTLILFGEPEFLTAHVSNQRQLESSQVDDQFLVHLDYKNGLRCTLGAGMLARIPTPRFRLTGMNGSYVKYGLDVQENQLKEGLTPKDSAYGLEGENSWGELDTLMDVQGTKLHFKGKVDTELGSYGSYYANVVDAIQGHAPVAVTAEQAAWVIHGIQLAIESSRSGQPADKRQSVPHKSIKRESIVWHWLGFPASMNDPHLREQQQQQKKRFSSNTNNSSSSDRNSKSTSSNSSSNSSSNGNSNSSNNNSSSVNTVILETVLRHPPNGISNDISPSAAASSPLSHLGSSATNIRGQLAGSDNQVLSSSLAIRGFNEGQSPSRSGEDAPTVQGSVPQSLNRASHPTQDSGQSVGPGHGSNGSEAGAVKGHGDETGRSTQRASWRTSLPARFQDHLKMFFSIHHKLFDLVAFYVVMFAINGQMTSLPTRLEWIGFCVQSIVALRRAFQTSIKHGLGLTSFLGMLDLLVGQLFLHQDRLGLLPTVANILVYFYVINLTRGLVFGDSVSCLLWFLFGLVDIYRKDPSSASILDLTPYKVIPVHTVGFGLYILMSELVDVMLHSAEPDPIPGRYLNYVGAQKQSPVSIRSSPTRSAVSQADPSSNLRFELCITEITPFTVSFCLNALSDASPPTHSSGKDSPPKNLSASAPVSVPRTTGTLEPTTEAIDLSSIKVGSAASASSSSSASVARLSKSTTTPRIISTSDIVIHVNYIPWRQVQYHFPDEQSFTIYGLTPSTDYEVEMKVHQFSSFVARVGTRAALPGTPIPTYKFEKAYRVPETTPKSNKNRRNRKNQRNQKDITDRNGDANKTKATTSAATAVARSMAAVDTPLSTTNGLVRTEKSHQPPTTLTAEKNRSALEPVSPNQALLADLQASLQRSTEDVNATKALIKKLKRDQGKAEAQLRQELEGIGRGQAKAAVQDQKRRQKLSFLQESIKQTDTYASALQEELRELKTTTLTVAPEMGNVINAIQALEHQIQACHSDAKAEISPLKQECHRLQTEMKRLESERTGWLVQTAQLQENEIARLQLRLQRLEQQQTVWKVAAEANKNKDRESGLKVAALEEENLKMTRRSEQLETSIQTLRTTNMGLKESIGKEMEIWEGLERELDAFEQADIMAFDQQPEYPMTGIPAQSAPFQPLRYLDMSVDVPFRDSQYWLSPRTNVSSGVDLWPKPAVKVGSGLWDAPLTGSHQDYPKSSGRTGRTLTDQ